MLCLARPTCPTLRLVRAFSSLFREETQFILAEAGAGEQLRLDGRPYLAGSEDLARPTRLQPASQVDSHIILPHTENINITGGQEDCLLFQLEAVGAGAGLQQVAAAVAEITNTRQPRLTAGVLGDTGQTGWW